MIFSKEFSSSNWCIFELHLAQNRILDSQTKGNLIVIARDDPEDHDVKKHVNKTVRYVLQTWTYLKWPQKDDEVNQGESEVNHQRGTGVNRRHEIFFMRLKQSILHHEKKKFGDFVP